MKKARNNYYFANIFAETGGFFINLPIGTFIAAGKPNLQLAAIGIGLVGISIPFYIAFNNHSKNAVDIYNSIFSQTNNNRLNFNF